MCTIQQEQQVFPLVINGEFTPHIANLIFQFLDLNTLIKSRLVSNDWKDFVNYRTSLWSNISAEKYIKAAGEGRIDICRLIIQKAENKNPSEWHQGFTPMHAAAKEGHWRICQLILDSTARHRRGKLKSLTQIN